MKQSLALNGPVTASLRHHDFVWVPASLHHHRLHSQHGRGLCAVVGAPRRIACCLAPPLVRLLCACSACCLGFWHPAAVVAWHLVLCRGCSRQRAPLACLLDPHWCTTPHRVRSLSIQRSVVPSLWCLPLPWAFPSGFTGRLRGARRGRPRIGLMVPAADHHRRRGAWLAPHFTSWAPRDGVIPGASLQRWS